MIRSAMENGEEEVPSRVWLSISSRLAAEKASRKRLLRKWAAVLSAAAALAAVFFTVNFNRYNTTDQGSSNLTDDGAHNPAVATTSIQNKNTTQDAAAGHAPVSETYHALPRISTEKLKAAAVCDMTGLSKPAPSFARKKFTSAGDCGDRGEITGDDIFFTGAEEMPDRVKRKREKISLAAGGSVMTNGNAEGIATRHMGRPGVGHAKTGVTQSSKESSYSIPLSAGLSIRIPISRRWSVNTGLSYSFLERTFTGIYTEAEDGAVIRTANGDIRHTMHYLGIPLSFSYDIVKSGSTQLYAFAGGETEKAVHNRYKIPYGSSSIYYTPSVNGVQVSASAGFGVNFMLTDHLGFYIDPSIRYYFDCKQPTSLRTQQPLMFNFELGLRLNLR